MSAHLTQQSFLLIGTQPTDKVDSKKKLQKTKLDLSWDSDPQFIITFHNLCFGEADFTPILPTQTVILSARCSMPSVQCREDW